LFKINNTKKSNPAKYFSSHGETMKMREFIEIEVKERGNYPKGMAMP
jgi:hypothetical protein